MHLRPELKGTNSIKSKSMQNRRSQALHSLWQGNILARFLFDLFMHQLNNAKYFSPFLLYLLVHHFNESNSCLPSEILRAHHHIWASVIIQLELSTAILSAIH